MNSARHQSTRPTSSPISARAKRHVVAVVSGVVLTVLLAAESAGAQSVWDQIAEFVGLRGKPVPASANVLSEHEIAELNKMAPQDQATLLLERSINHYRGANDQIAKRVAGWRGKVDINGPLGSLY